MDIIGLIEKIFRIPDGPTLGADFWGSGATVCPDGVTMGDEICTDHDQKKTTEPLTSKI